MLFWWISGLLLFLLGALVILTSNPAVSPFIYTLF